MFHTILIANRGEIACRIIRTARRMGLRSIAVYSEADINAPHVNMADEAYCIGPAPARESYLCGDKILQIAKQAKAQAIHPGYGFLSENTDFAEACETAGIVFIGPPAAAILAMGNKSQAKQLMETAGVPLIPGYHGQDQSLDVFIHAAKKMGFPVLLKASAGGGGKGMRVVNAPEEMETALAGAKREALSSFGNDDILLEKYLLKPRHIEIQLFSDQHDNHLYLYERDCSIQRRHQKIIEEAPAPGLSETLRVAMGQAAIACAKAIHYVGAGTIEFLVDEEGQFYFMEMNTRLQVEHPVTEMITGLDLVEWQLRIASGEKLPLAQDNLRATGHAIEVRIYAEDPDNHFLPSIGTITYLEEPTTHSWLRIDTGVKTGSQISQFYDPLIAKLIVWGETRTQANLRLLQALSHYRIAGVQTNLKLLGRIAAHPEYQSAALFTAFIETHYDDLFAPVFQENRPLAEPANENHDLLIAAALWQIKHSIQLHHPLQQPWLSGRAFRINMPEEQFIEFELKGKPCMIRVARQTPSLYHLWLGTDLFEVNIIMADANQLQLSINGTQRGYTVVASNHQVTVFNELRSLLLSLPETSWETSDAQTGAGHLRSPMPGTVTAILVKEGQAVKRGEPLLIVEAMKMEHTISASSDGVVQSICYQIGESVDEGAELAVLT